MISIGGELGINIASVRSDPWFIRPTTSTASNDLTMLSISGEYFHICGNNDWGFLALELLEPIRKEAKDMMQKIKKYRQDGTEIKAIMLGVNDKRIMDIYFGGKDKCDRICGIPVILSEEQNLFKCLVEYEEELPFI